MGVCGLKRMKCVGGVGGERDENGEEGGRGVGFMLRKEEGSVWLDEIRMGYENL